MACKPVGRAYMRLMVVAEMLVKTEMLIGRYQNNSTRTIIMTEYKFLELVL